MINFIVLRRRFDAEPGGIGDGIGDGSRGVYPAPLCGNFEQPQAQIFQHIDRQQLANK